MDKEKLRQLRELLIESLEEETEDALPVYKIEIDSSGQINLAAEREKQVIRLADLYAEPLGLSKEEYIDSLPELTIQSELFKGKFDIPLIVQTPAPKLSLSDMLSILGIRNFTSDVKFTEWSENSTKAAKPYSTWVNDGSATIGMSIDEVRKHTAYYRGCNIYDGLAFYSQHPQVLDHHFITFPDSAIESRIVKSESRRILKALGSKENSDNFEYSAGISLYESTAILYFPLTNTPSPIHGSMLAGREEVEGSKT